MSSKDVQWEKWIEAHKKWKEDYKTRQREILGERGYAYGEKKRALKDLQREFMNRLWELRQEYLDR